MWTLRPLLVEKEAPVQPGGKLLIWGGGIAGLLLLAVAYFFSQQEVDWQKIDADHKAKVEKFLANIGTDDKFWNNDMEYTMDGDVKVFEITVSGMRTWIVS